MLAMASSDTHLSPSARSPADAGDRLAQQLQALSQVLETLTYRLLELEEMVALQEQSVRALQQQGSAAASSNAAALRMDDTEQRLSNLESLLADAVVGVMPGRHLHSVAAEAPMSTAAAPGTALSGSPAPRRPAGSEALDRSAEISS